MWGHVGFGSKINLSFGDKLAAVLPLSWTLDGYLSLLCVVCPFPFLFQNEQFCISCIF